MWDVDFMHPIDPGMKAINDMVVNLIQQTAMSLLMNPFGPMDRELLKEPLPKPMHPSEWNKIECWVVPLGCWVCRGSFTSGKPGACFHAS